MILYWCAVLGCLTTIAGNLWVMAILTADAQRRSKEMDLHLEQQL